MSRWWPASLRKRRVAAGSGSLSNSARAASTADASPGPRRRISTSTARPYRRRRRSLAGGVTLRARRHLLGHLVGVAPDDRENPVITERADDSDARVGR